MKKTINGYEIKPGADLIGANLIYADLYGADLSGANLEGADLSGANLRRADLIGAVLSGASLNNADLRGANLRGAILSGAILSGADLSSAYLSGTNLIGADLSGAYLSSADLSDAYLHGVDLSYANLRSADLEGAKLPAVMVALPPVGTAFTGWKKCRDGVIVELTIPAEANRTASLVGRKCRAEFAVVKAVHGAEEGVSFHDGVTRYIVGEPVRPDSFNDDIRIECTNGVHFFETREEAERFQI